MKSILMFALLFMLLKSNSGDKNNLFKRFSAFIDQYHEDEIKRDISALALIKKRFTFNKQGAKNKQKYYENEINNNGESYNQNYRENNRDIEITRLIKKRYTVNNNGKGYSQKSFVDPSKTVINNNGLNYKIEGNQKAFNVQNATVLNSADPSVEINSQKASTEATSIQPNDAGQKQTNSDFQNEKCICEKMPSGNKKVALQNEAGSKGAGKKFINDDDDDDWMDDDWMNKKQTNKVFKVVPIQNIVKPKGTHNNFNDGLIQNYYFKRNN